MKTIIKKTLFILLLFFGCRKEQPTTIPETTEGTILTLEQVKAFYKSDTTNHIYWDKATYIEDKDKAYWLAGLEGRPKFENLSLGYRKIAFYRDSANQIKSRILEIIPDATYLQRKRQASENDFTGRIFIYDSGYHLLYGKTYLKGKQTGQIKPLAAGEKPVTVNKLEPVTECAWVAENYVDADGNAVIYSEQVCGTSYFDLGGTGGDDSSGGGDPFNTQPDLPPVKGGGIPPATPPQVSNLPGENKSGINPKDYMNCFQNIPDNGASMKITIYVQEPWPGTTFNIGPNSVGHTAISLTKTNGATSITQTVGFYPDATGFDKMHAPAKLVDNGGDLEYNVSISYDVTAENFNKIVNYISSPPTTYDITDFNCTNFVNSACLAGNINLPDPFTYSPLYPQSPALAPSALGNSIEKLKGNSNVNTTGGNTPFSKGPCN